MELFQHFDRQAGACGEKGKVVESHYSFLCVESQCWHSRSESLLKWKIEFPAKRVGAGRTENSREGKHMENLNCKNKGALIGVLFKQPERSRLRVSQSLL